MRRKGQLSRPSARTCCRFSSFKTLLTRRRVSPRRRQCPAVSIGRFCGVPHWPVLGVPQGSALYSHRQVSLSLRVRLNYIHLCNERVFVNKLKVIGHFSRSCSWVL